uniref:Uncharacterized protein n=1 Tax=viral metagenome TaxID=1070528 RepID=A0A6M3KZM4_9ZZZZ
MKPKNGTVTKIAGVVAGGVALLWIGGVSTGIIRAEVRESRLIAVEAIVVKMQTSVEDLANIRDAMKQQTKAMQKIIDKLEEKAKDGE